VVGMRSGYTILVKSVAVIISVLNKQLIGPVELLIIIIALLLAYCPVRVMLKSFQYIGMLDIFKRRCIAWARKSPSSLSPLS